MVRQDRFSLALRNMVFSPTVGERRLWGAMVAIQAGVDYLSAQNIGPRLIIGHRSQVARCSIGILRVADKSPRLIRLTSK